MGETHSYGCSTIHNYMQWGNEGDYEEKINAWSFNAKHFCWCFLFVAIALKLKQCFGYLKIVLFIKLTTKSSVSLSLSLCLEHSTTINEMRENKNICGGDWREGKTGWKKNIWQKKEKDSSAHFIPNRNNQPTDDLK